MKIGFTGTQRGMTKEQLISFEAGLRFVMDGDDTDEFHHGDCIGADAQAHMVAFGLKFRIIVHPPIIDKKRAFCKGYSEIRIQKPYFDRNHDIVDQTEILIATPGEAEEQLRSGTWATIRYARKKGGHPVIIGPDGIPL